MTGNAFPFSSMTGDGDEGEPAVEPARLKANGHWADPPRRWEEDDPERLVLREETRGVIERALEALPPQQRVVVTLRDIDGLESEEVCHVLAISETNQRVLLHRGRAKLRRALERHLAAR